MYTLEDSIETHARWAEVDKWGPGEPVNVFYLDHDPKLAAQYHCDAHVNQMFRETCQLLSTAWHVLNDELVEGSDRRDILFPYELATKIEPGSFWHLNGQKIYACSHPHHPTAKWVRESTGNYDWLWRLGMSLVEEHKHRWGRLRPTAPIMWALERPPPALPAGEQSQPPPMMPEECCIAAGPDEWDSVLSYRNYYVTVKRPLLKWTHRDAPEWVSRA